MRELINLILENEQPPVIDALQDLVQLVKTGDIADPTVQKVANLLTSIENTAERLEQTPVNTAPDRKERPAPAPTVAPAPAPEPADAEVVNETRLSKLDALNQRLLNNKQWPQIVQALTLAGMSEADIIKAANSLIQHGREEEWKASLEWDDTLEAEANALANKVV